MAAIAAATMPPAAQAHEPPRAKTTRPVTATMPSRARASHIVMSTSSGIGSMAIPGSPRCSASAIGARATSTQAMPSASARTGTERMRGASPIHAPQPMKAATGQAHTYVGPMTLTMAMARNADAPATASVVMTPRASQAPATATAKAAAAGMTIQGSVSSPRATPLTSTMRLARRPAAIVASAIDRPTTRRQ